MSDENFYLDATNEIENGDKITALWAKAVALTDGDCNKAKYLYIRLRVENLKTSCHVDNTIDSEADNNLRVEQLKPLEVLNIDREDPLLEYNPDNFISKLTCGGYGLAVTYWVFGVVVGLVFYIFENITARTNNTGALVFLLVIQFIYSLIVANGIWNASKKYKGPQIWSILSRIAVVINLLLLSCMFLIMIAS